MDDIEAVKQEQERHLQLLHRNFHTLQNSMDTANQAASNKVFNHLMDNQTLLKEVNNLRAEVSIVFFLFVHLIVNLFMYFIAIAIGSSIKLGESSFICSNVFSKQQ